MHQDRGQQIIPFSAELGQVVGVTGWAIRWRTLYTDPYSGKSIVSGWSQARLSSFRPGVEEVWKKDRDPTLKVMESEISSVV